MAKLEIKDHLTNTLEDPSSDLGMKQSENDSNKEEAGSGSAEMSKVQYYSSF